MAKNRLYDKNSNVVGTFYQGNNDDLRGLQFKRGSELHKKFTLNLINFLEKEELRIVSNEASFRKHYNHKKYNKKREFDIYYKYKNPRTHLIEIKKIGKLK